MFQKAKEVTRAKEISPDLSQTLTDMLTTAVLSNHTPLVTPPKTLPNP